MRKCARLKKREREREREEERGRERERERDAMQDGRDRTTLLQFDLLVVQSTRQSDAAKTPSDVLTFRAFRT